MACIRSNRTKPTKIRVWATQRRALLSKMRFWKRRSTKTDLITRKILALKSEPRTPFNASVTLEAVDVAGIAEGCMPWENHIDNRMMSPTRQTTADKPNSILKFITNSLYPQSLFPCNSME
jgi:hypothetical protein